MAATNPGIVDRTEASNVMARSTMPPLLSAARIPSAVPKNVASSRAKKAIDRLTGRRCMTLSATGMWVNHELPRSPCRQSHSQSQ